MRECMIAYGNFLCIIIDWYKEDAKNSIKKAFTNLVKAFFM